MKRDEVAKKNKNDKPIENSEKAETLWEIFEKTGSIGAYLLYTEHVEDRVSKSTDPETTSSR